MATAGGLYTSSNSRLGQTTWDRSCDLRPATYGAGDCVRRTNPAADEDGGLLAGGVGRPRSDLNTRTRESGEPSVVERVLNSRCVSPESIYVRSSVAV